MVFFYNKNCLHLHPETSLQRLGLIELTSTKNPIIYSSMVINLKIKEILHCEKNSSNKRE